MRSLIFLTFTAFNFATNAVIAQETDNIRDAIKLDAEQFLSGFYQGQDNVSVSVRPVDSRLSIPECIAGFEYSLPGVSKPSRHTTVKALCPTSGWSILMKAKIVQLVPTVVVTRSMGKGEVITSGDIDVQLKEATFVTGAHFNSVEQVIGAKTTRFISSQRRMSPKDVCIVCKGDYVTLTASSGSLAVNVLAEALGDGLIGDTIQVRNRSSSRIVRAKVGAVGKAEIKL